MHKYVILRFSWTQNIYLMNLQSDNIWVASFFFVTPIPIGQRGHQIAVLAISRCYMVVIFVLCYIPSVNIVTSTFCSLGGLYLIILN